MKRWGHLALAALCVAGATSVGGAAIVARNEAPAPPPVRDSSFYGGTSQPCLPMSGAGKVVSAVSDFGIALAYFSIPLSMFWFMKQAQTHLPVESVVHLFVAFILLCGTTHFIGAFVPFYHWTFVLLNVSKILTSIVSLYTAYVLIRLAPKAVMIPRFIQALENELAKKHLSERSLRYQSDSLVLLRHIIIKIRRTLARAAILRISAREIGRALLKRDLFSKPPSELGEDGSVFAAPGSPDAAENPLDASARLLEEYLDADQYGPDGDSPWMAQPEGRYGGRCLIYLPSFQETKMSLFAEYSNGVEKLPFHDLDTRVAPIAVALETSKCITLFTDRDSEAMREIFTAVEIGHEHPHQRVRHRLGPMDDIGAVIMIRFPLPTASDAGFATSGSPGTTPAGTPGADQNATVGESTSKTSNDRMDASEWGLLVLHIQDPGPDKDNLPERVEFAASLVTDTAEQIGIALNQANAIEVDRLRMENLKQQNELLLAARKEIEVAAEHRNFLTIVSHELRTPLYAVTALSGILLDGFFANAENEDDAEFAEAQELVTIIKQSGDLLLQIVSNILDFSKYESSSLALEKRPFAIREAMDLAIEIVSTAASKDGPQINAYLFEEPETRVAAGDVTRFRQILVNLLNNAIKFTPLEGDVVLILRTSVPADDPTRILVEGAVRDTGVGVSHEHKEKLFKQFAQLDESITRRFGGTGLGLNIVKKLTTLMGGDVWLSDGAGMHEEDLEVLSRLENRGATFCFRVFLDRLSPGKAKLADSVQEPLELSRSPSSISFAIVDNRPLNRDALRYLLQALGVDSAAIIECSSLGDFLLTDKSVSALVMDFRTCMHEVSALKCILRSGLSKRCLLLCGPGSHKTFRKSLRLTKAHEVTVLLRPAKMSAVVRFINELPNDTLSVADVRDVLRAKPVFFEATDAGGGTAQVEAVKSPATPLRTSTTDTSGLTRVADVSLEEIGDSSDSSLPTILTTPSGIGTPQAGLEALSSPRASAVEPRDYFSLAHNLSATTVLESPAPGPDRQTPSPSKPAKRPAAAAEIFVDTKLGPVKLPVFRVLVVEDNLINQRVTGKLLQRLHQKYDFANDGFQAIERVQSAADDGRQYEVIFMDLQMPEMDGFEATRRIRELAGDAIYICALSGNAFAGDRVRAQESGMNDFVPKPARQQDLLAALGRLVQQGR